MTQEPSTITGHRPWRDRVPARGRERRLVATSLVRDGTLLGLLIIVGLAIYGQQCLDARDHSERGFVAYALAAVGFGVLFRQVALERPAEIRSGLARPQLWLLLVAALSAVPAFFRFAGNQLTPLGTALWLLSLALSLAAVWDVPIASMLTRFRELSSRRGIELSWVAVSLLIILIAGAFLRFYRLDEIPAEMGVDRPLMYENVEFILNGNYQIFFPLYPGREGLFFYLAAVHARLFGLSDFGILFTSAMIGLVTIPVMYLLGRELFNCEVGLYAAGFLAVSKWHVILSRTGLRAVLTPLLIALTGWFLVRAVRTRRWLDWGLTGLCLGVGLHTYNAFMLAPAAVVLFLALYVLSHREFVSRAIGPTAVLVFVAVLGFLPLARYAYDHPDTYLFRVATRVTSQEQPLPEGLLGTFIDNLRRSLLMFNYVGDSVFYNNVPFQRQLGFASGTLFVLGLAYLLVRWRHGCNVWVPAFLLVMLLPTALSLAFPNEVPGALRASGTIPPALLAVAVGLSLLRRRFAAEITHWAQRLSDVVPLNVEVRQVRPWFPVIGWLVSVVIIGVIVWEGVTTYQIYFGDYRDNLWRRNYSITKAMADVIVDFEGVGHVFVKGWPHMYDGRALRAQLQIQSGHGGWDDVEVTELRPDVPPLSDFEHGKALFLVSPDDKEARATLRAAFPNGVELEHRDFDGRPAFIEFIGER